MIENIKEIFPPKTGMQEKQLCKIQGMSKGLKVHAAWYLARLYEISYVERVKRNKNSHNKVDLRHLSLMSKESKEIKIAIIQYIYLLCRRSRKSIRFTM